MFLVGKGHEKTSNTRLAHTIHLKIRWARLIFTRFRPFFAPHAKYAECLKLGCRAEQGIGDRKFVLRDFVVRDPDGWGVRFGSFLEGRGRKEQEGPDDEIVVKGG